MRTKTRPTTLATLVFTLTSSTDRGPFNPTNLIDSPTTSRIISITSSDIPSLFFHALFTSHISSSSSSSIVPVYDKVELVVRVDEDDVLDVLDRGGDDRDEGRIHALSHDGHKFPDSSLLSHYTFH